MQSLCFYKEIDFYVWHHMFYKYIRSLLSSTESIPTVICKADATCEGEMADIYYRYDVSIYIFELFHSTFQFCPVGQDNLRLGLV